MSYSPLEKMASFSYKSSSLFSLLFGQLIRRTVHHFVNYVYIFFRLGCSLSAFFRLDYFGTLQLSQPRAFLRHLFSVISIKYSAAQL